MHFEKFFFLFFFGQKEEMETTVVTCQVPRMVGCGTYEHTFDFPEEWETEKRILLIGIWISDTSERMGSFDFWYYNLRINVDYRDAFIVDEGDTNQLSKFSVPVVIDKASDVDGRLYSAEYYGNVQQDDLTITYQWRSVPDDVDVGVFAYTLHYDRNYNPFYGYVIPYLAQNNSVYLQIDTMNYESDVCTVQPADHLELREDMSWTMVTPTVIRIDGPSERFLLDYRDHTCAEFVVYRYFLVSVQKIK